MTSLSRFHSSARVGAAESYDLDEEIDGWFARYNRAVDGCIDFVADGVGSVWLGLVTQAKSCAYQR